MFRIPEDSPLRKPPLEFSRKQVLVLDGIRYAAEMADIAYERLHETLQRISATADGLPVRDNATAMLDAWSIVDSAHRFRDLIETFPGLPKSPWRRILRDRTEDIATLRNHVQHQREEIAALAETGGQLYGYLSWAEIVDRRYTGNWFMLVAGADYVGDQFTFVGPVQLPFRVPPGRIRLNAFGQAVYLGRTLIALRDAVVQLSRETAKGTIRTIDPPALERRGADIIYSAAVEVVCAAAPANPPA